MGYVNYKAEVKKANLKKDGVIEIGLEAPVSLLKGQMEALSQMVGSKVEISMEDLIVNFTIKVNAKTNEPLTTYKVDERGVVSEVKPAAEQLEADLGLPPEEVPTKEQNEEIKREIIDQFISEGMSPNYEDLPYDFAYIVKRYLDGEKYEKLAKELNTTSAELIRMVDSYRKRVAPLAQKWWEWKQSNEKQQDDNDGNEEQSADDTEKGNENDAA
jgi:hypothetical protein